MGDRVSVTLTVLASQAKEAEALFDDWSASTEEEYPLHNTDVKDFTFDEVNYGQLEFRDALKKAGIAYDVAWEKGHEFGKGTEYCRFDEKGEAAVWEQYEGDEDPPITALMERIDQPDELIKYIRSHHERHQYPSWDNQEDFGKIYRARLLIQPKGK